MSFNASKVKFPSMHSRTICCECIQDKVSLDTSKTKCYCNVLGAKFSLTCPRQNTSKIHASRVKCSWTPPWWSAGDVDNETFFACNSPSNGLIFNLLAPLESSQFFPYRIADAMDAIITPVDAVNSMCAVHVSVDTMNTFKCNVDVLKDTLPCNVQRHLVKECPRTLCLGCVQGHFSFDESEDTGPWMFFVFFDLDTSLPWMQVHWAMDTLCLIHIHELFLWMHPRALGTEYTLP